MIGAEGIPPPAPPSQQGAACSQAGPQAGSHAGAQTGAAHGSGRDPPQGERNSMNEGRRQLLALPKQLLQPGAAARLNTVIARHTARVMMRFSTAFGRGRSVTCATLEATSPPTP